MTLKPTLARVAPAATLALALLAPVASTASSHDNSGSNMSMNMSMIADAPIVPAVHGFMDGVPILFMHTEVSDPDISRILVDMMGGSPVPVVASLAKAPPEMLAPVYVFTNGYGGTGPMGPLGGQPDIFVGAPGDPGYSPLREVILVAWSDPSKAHELRSWTELKAAIDGNQVTTKKAGVVVNMPLLTWPGGSR